MKIVNRKTKQNDIAAPPKAFSSRYVWKVLIVADTDREAEEIGVSSFLNIKAI